jgi:hypothetical protein
MNVLGGSAMPLGKRIRVGALLALVITIASGLGAVNALAKEVFKETFSGGGANWLWADAID